MNKNTFSTALALTAIACALGGNAGPALSQSPPIASQPQTGGPPSLEQRRAERAARRDKAQVLWKQWRANPASGQERLAEIVALEGVQPTKENAAALIQAMSIAGTPQDKALLARIAGDLYQDLAEQGDKQTQETIRTHISEVAKLETEPKLWRSAAFTYSRMGWFPDSMQVFARSRLVWGDRDYYGELAHAVLSAPKAEQVKIIKALEAGDTRPGGGPNDFGKEILANQLKNEEAAKMLHPEAARAALAMFKKSEPEFAVEPEKMGGGGLAAYNEWVTTVVALTAHINGEPPKNVLPRLVYINGDPRKLIAILQDSESAALLRASLDQPSLAAIDARLMNYSATYKTNRNVQDFVTIARSRSAERK